jgi:tyrosinase
MLKSRFCTLFACLTAVVGAAPNLSSFSHVIEPLPKRQNPNSPTPTAPFAVTGVLTNSVQPRLEIRQLAANADQFNIFLLALQVLQSQNETYFLSYYQLAAIHGAPAVPWNGVTGIPAADRGIYYPGYCTHQSNIFLPWHRPYLALFEVSDKYSDDKADVDSKCSSTARSMLLPHFLPGRLEIDTWRQQ